MNIGCVSVGGMINNVKTFASILMPGVQHMRHTHLPEHKFVSGQPETGVELAEDLERICMNFGPIKSNVIDLLKVENKEKEEAA